MLVEGKKDTDKWYSFVLISDTDFKTPVTGKAHTDLTAKYYYGGATSLTTYTLSADNIKEAGEGGYSILIGADEFASLDNVQLKISCTGCITQWIPIEVTTRSKEEGRPAIYTANVTQIAGSANIDGTAIATALAKILGFTSGKVVRTGNVYAYRNQGDTADLFTITASTGGRTVA